MSEAKTRDSWTPQQQKYIDFLGRGKKTKQGTKRTNEQFAQAIGVNPDTLYSWKKLPGFMQAVFDASITEVADFLPDMIKAQAAAATGQELTTSKGKKLKPGSTQAFLALMRQANVLQSDRIDHTTNGRDLPTPILGGNKHE